MNKTQSATLLSQTIDGITFSYMNQSDFDFLYNEIFKVQEYRFSARTRSPFILDCGANIGMSVLYFKKLYPQAKIVAFEPNPETFKLLERNVQQNQLRDVQLVNAAVAENDGEMEFSVNDDETVWSLSDTGITHAYADPAGHKTIRVNKVRLSSYITEPVDYLKLDIEGMEEIVVREIEEKINSIEEIWLEFHHNVANQDNNLDHLLAMLSRKGFMLAFERGRKILNTRQIKRSMERNEQYLFMLFAHRQRLHVWWQSRVVPQAIRVHNRIKRLWK